MIDSTRVPHTRGRQRPRARPVGPHAYRTVTCALLVAMAPGCRKAADRTASAPPVGAGDTGFIARLGAMARHDDSAKAANADRDPCALVTRQEAEVYLGALARDPYRSTRGDLAGDPNGKFCVYRTSVGRSIIITPHWTDGKLTMRMANMGQNMMGKVLTDESGQADTLGGDWDAISWMGNDLYVLKGDVSIDVDVGGSKAGVVGASKLAQQAMPRIAKPLAYDGAKAAIGAPGALVAARDPCLLFPRKEVEAVLGPLASDPVRTKGGNDGCVFNLPPGSSMLRYVTAEVQWSGGFKTMNQWLSAAHQTTTSFTNKITPGGTEGMQRDSGVQRQIAKLGQAIGGTVNQDKLFLKTDTTGQVGGPWDDAIVLLGNEFMAVKKDVFMSVDLRLFPLEKARGLVAVAMNRL